MNGTIIRFARAGKLQTTNNNPGRGRKEFGKPHLTAGNKFGPLNDTIPPKYSPLIPSMTSKNEWNGRWLVLLSSCAAKKIGQLFNSQMSVRASSLQLNQVRSMGGC